MNGKQEYDGKYGSRNPLLVALIGTFLGSSGSIAVVFNSPIGKSITRPDPFTGTQGATLEARIDSIYADVSDIKAMLNVGILPRAEERLNNLENHHIELEKEFDEWVKYHQENFVPAKHLEPRRVD